MKAHIRQPGDGVSVYSWRGAEGELAEVERLLGYPEYAGEEHRMHLDLLRSALAAGVRAALDEIKLQTADQLTRDNWPDLFWALRLLAARIERGEVDL